MCGGLIPQVALVIYVRQAKNIAIVNKHEKLSSSE